MNDLINALWRDAILTCEVTDVFALTVTLSNNLVSLLWG
jgi:hypothetical protein